METGNYAYLIKGWDEFSDVKIEEKAVDLWQNIYEEYCDLTNDNTSLLYYKTLHRITWLKTRFFVCHKIILELFSREMRDEIFNEYIDSLKKWGFKYPYDKLNLKGLKDLSKQIEFTKNEIGLKESELKSYKQGKSIPLIKQVVLAEQALGKNVIDPKETSVMKWVYYMETVREVNKERQKQYGK